VKVVNSTTLRPGNLPIANGVALAVIPLLLAMLVLPARLYLVSVPA
jgi:hypothetical protein